MWKLIIAIIDFIRSLLVKKADSSAKQEQENVQLEEQRQQLETQVEEKYEQEKSQVPTEGGDLVDYWTKRGMLDKPPDPTPGKR